MVIGERLRELREERKFSQGEIENERVCCVVTFPVSRMATRFRRLKRWKS